MSSCPTCHIYKGLWSPLNKNKEGVYICKVNGMHKFTRDTDGNFHSVEN